MKLDLVGPSYQMFSLPFDAQRTVNLFPVMDPKGKEVSSLYMTPGLLQFTDTGVGPVRGAFTADNGRCFFVSNSSLYEIDSDGTITNQGSLDQSAGNVTFAENFTQLAICDGQNLYIFTYSTDNFVKVIVTGFPGAETVTYLDGYFITNDPDSSGKFRISALFDGFTWNPLDFATAESSPDGLIRVFAALNQLFLIGSHTIEIWTNTGGSAASTFPFTKITGNRVDVGTESPYSVVNADNAMFWLGKDLFGRAIVYRTSGFTPQRISTEPIELKLQQISDLTQVVGYAYQEQGHLFYVLTSNNLETSFVYDISTQQWHERAYLNSAGQYEPHLGSCCTFAFNKHLVGDRRNGLIYDMNMNNYDDNGDRILRKRTFTHLSDEGKRFRMNQLIVGIDGGVGTQNGDDTDPTIAIRMSSDGAKTWSSSYIKPIGKVGQYQQRICWRRLGIYKQNTIEISTSSRVQVAITGAYLQ